VGAAKIALMICSGRARMSGKTPLVEPITGFTIAVFKTVQPDESANVIYEVDLKLNRVGGAHITNAESLIMMIEDAVFGEIGES
jgi:hypothetical protein